MYIHWVIHICPYFTHIFPFLSLLVDPLLITSQNKKKNLCIRQHIRNDILANKISESILYTISAPKIKFLCLDWHRMINWCFLCVNTFWKSKLKVMYGPPCMEKSNFLNFHRKKLPKICLSPYHHPIHGQPYSPLLNTSGSAHKIQISNF